MTHKQLLLLLLKGRDCVGGSPNGLGSIDFSLELRIADGRLELDTNIVPERARAIRFAQHQDGLDHPVVTVHRPRGEGGGGPEGRERVGEGTPWPGLITRALAEDGAAEEAEVSITDADALPLENLLIWEYLEVLDGFARAVNRLDGPQLDAFVEARRGSVVAAREAVSTVGVAHAPEVRAQEDMDRAITITRTRRQLEQDAGAQEARRVIREEEAAEADVNGVADHVHKDLRYAHEAIDRHVEDFEDAAVDDPNDEVLVGEGSTVGTSGKHAAFDDIKVGEAGVIHQQTVGL